MTVTPVPPMREDQQIALGPLLEHLAYDDETECWLWTGELSRRGLPLGITAAQVSERTGIGTKMTRASVPDYCGNLACLNPIHHHELAITTYMAWMDAHAPVAGKCRKGHLIDGDNCYTTPGGTKVCVKCRKEREKRRKPRPKTRTVIRLRSEGTITPAPDDWSGPAMILKRRYQCPGCSRTFGHRDTAENHMGTCFKLPANRACRTCANYDSDVVRYGPDEPGREPSCAVGIAFGRTADGRVKLALRCDLWQGR